MWMAHKNKRIKVINIQEFLPVIRGERREVVLFFVRPGSSSWSWTREAEPNKMAVAKQYTNEVFDLQSIQVFRGLSYIATAK